MPEPAFSSVRLEQLRQRWEKDPSSRLFLQLAEEYRRVGRLTDAVAVLQEGLRRQPNYPSALVALGRCLLEQKEASTAAATLEKVLALDPTQLVANKLLIEAYLQLHEPAKARERLDLYALLNDSDPEIGAFETRMLKLEEKSWAPPMPAESEMGRAPTPPSAGVAPAAVSAPEPLPVHAADALPPPAPAVAPVPPPVPFVAAAPPSPLVGSPRAPARSAGAAPTTPVVSRRTSEGEVFPLSSSAAKAVDLDRIPSAASLRARPAGSADEPFGPLADAADRARYLRALSGEGIFRAAPALAAPPVEPASPAAPLPVFAERWGTAEEIPEPLVEAPLESAEWPVEPSPVALEPTPAAAEWEMAAAAPEVEPQPPAAELPVTAGPAFAEPTPVFEPPPPAPAFEPPPPAPAAGPVPLAAEAIPAAGPTATLGELYLRQGHLREAEAAFRAVLSGQPDHGAARLGLDETLRRRGEPLNAAQLLRGVRAEQLADMGPAARRAVMLKSYLERIRLRARHDVPPATQHDQ